MNISIGDLVKYKKSEKGIGIVVDKRLSNQGLLTSEHVRHILDVYPHVYYVYFSDVGRLGPFNEVELQHVI